jgi:hypothetical protein
MEKVVSSVASTVTTAVLAWIVRSHDPFYSDGWFRENPEWLFIPAIIVVAATVLSLRTSGFWALVVLTLAVAGVFAWLYHRSDQSDPWPIITWVLHLIVASMFAGVVAGGARLVFVWWRDQPPPPPPPGGTTP